MTKLGGWKRTVLVVAVAAPVAAGVSLGGAAFADSHQASVPARSVRVEPQRADLPRIALPNTVRQDETTYRVSGDECAGSVCAKGVAVTTPAADLSSVGGPQETPTVELSTGEIAVSVTIGSDSAGVSARYGAIGTGADLPTR